MRGCACASERVFGRRFVALVAPDEWSKGMVRIKDLRMEDKDKNQKDMPLSELGSWRTVFA